MGIFTQITPPLPRARNTLEQTQHMPGNMTDASLAEFTLNVRIHGAHYRHRIGIDIRGTKDLPVYRRQNTRILIRLAPDHHAIHMLQVCFGLFQRLDTTVNGSLSDAESHASVDTHTRIIERRDLTVFFRT